jgi:DNA-binding SARP family transcriptional activator
LFVEAAGLFHRLGAGVLEAWARAGAAVSAARVGDQDAWELVAVAETTARATSTWGALVVGWHASAIVEPSRAEEYLALADQLDGDCVMQLSARRLAHPAPEELRAAAAVTCFGDFSLTIGGSKVDLAEVKPRVRSLVRLLALHVGHAVHRETLIEALWPEANGQTGTRNLQVAASAARQLLEHTRPGEAAIVREGDAYRLVLPEGAEVDLLSFDEQCELARRAKTRSDGSAMREALTRCLDVYGGDVLDAEGPAEWVVEIRERYRIEAADAAEALAEAHLEAGDHLEAARACERGLIIDRYRDQLWRLRADALEGAGDLAAATRTRQGYAEMLRDLGVTTS